MASFPNLRLRRLREHEAMRRLVRETEVTAKNLIYPIFVTHGRNVRREIAPMPGCYQLSLDRLADEVKEIAGLGIAGVLLFGLPESKDNVGSGAYDAGGIVQEAVGVIKRAAPGLLVVCDVCL